MARTTADFKDSDLLAYAMDGRMILVKDGTDRYNTTLIVDNKVRYSNTLEGMVKILRDRTRLARLTFLPKDYQDRCHWLANLLVEAAREQNFK